MKPKENETRQRRSIRIPGYDYTTPGGYFITLVTQDRKCLFGEICEERVNLNPLGKLVEYEWKRLENRFNFVEMGDWVVMPNHLHGIIILKDVKPNLVAAGILTESFGSPVKGSLPTIIRSYKSTVTKRYQNLLNQCSCNLWQRNYYEHIIRDDNDLARIREYIAVNPLKWLEDREYTE